MSDEKTGEGEKPWVHYERHPDDEIFDHVEIDCVPRYKTSGMSGDQWRVSFRLRMYAKGALLREGSYNSLSDLAAHLPWVLRTHFESAHEDDAAAWTKYLAAEDGLCHQPGCKEPSTVHVRMKQEGSRDGVHLRPVAPYNEIRRSWCARHERRGDSSRTDCDANYEVVSRVAPGAPLVADERPAAFGGVIDLSDEEKPS